MPAINVARTDTFEQQRVKINEIGTRLFNVTGGGTDLTTGNLKLGDGTISNPSLAFETDNFLGIYRSGTKTLGFVSDQKRIAEYSDSKVSSFKDLTLTKNQIFTAGTTIRNGGSGYQEGIYTDIPVTGGSGASAELTVYVIAYSGTVTNFGQNYSNGSFGSVLLEGGNGTGATASFTVDGIGGTITNNGSGYVANFNGVDVPLTGGSGTGALANILVDAAGAILDVAIVDHGQNYVNGDLLSVSANFDGVGAGGGFQFRVDGIPGVVRDFSFSAYGTGYQAGDVLTLPTTQTGITTTLSGTVNGVTSTLGATAQITVASTSGIAAGMTVFGDSETNVGVLAANTTVLSVDSATQITLSAVPTTPGAVSLGFSGPRANNAEIVVTDASTITVGMTVSQTSGTGTLAANTTVQAVDTVNNIITLDQNPTGAGSATLSFTPPFGDPVTAFSYTVGNLGVIDSIIVTEGGSGYEEGDLLSVNGEDLVQDISYTVTSRNVLEATFQGNVSVSAISVGDVLVTAGGEGAGGAPYEVYKIDSSGGFIDAVYLEDTSGQLNNGDVLEDGSSNTVGTIDTCTAGDPYYFYALGDAGASMTPDLTLYSGSTYNFDISDSSLSTYGFALSAFRDGSNAPSLVTNVATTLSNSSTVITVPSSAGILPGMSVSLLSGSGVLLANTEVVSITGNNVTLNKVALTSGPAVLEFAGVEYTTGVTKNLTNYIIKIEDDTPTLYAFSAELANLGGKDNDEATFTIDTNNPVTFGSGLSLESLVIDSSDIIKNEVLTGKLTTQSIQTGDFQATTGEVSQTLTAPTIAGGTISLNTITNSTGSLYATATNFYIDGNLDLCSGKGSFNSSTGNLTISGIIKTTDSVNVNDALIIDDNTISSTATNNINLNPALTHSVIVNATTSLVIPAGTDLERPGLPLSGAIRFNTDSNQYEGYSASSNSWASLGGIRDQDGNTYILAEESVGSNDNTFWFYNDDVNTLKLSPEYLEFENVKKIRSTNTAAPDYDEWRASSPAELGDYLKYRNNIYEVTGVLNTNPGDINLTATSGNEPIHTSGATTNGDLTLTWYATAVSSLTFEEISEVRIDPLGSTDLVINNELRFSGNTISTDTNDLNIAPNAGQKVKVDSSSSLVIPVGNNNEKGNPERGSIRYNTDDLQFEGYNGAQWGGLGGVKDIDQDTYIIPETAPNADEDILYFYNGNSNTLQLTTAGLEFHSIDTLTSTVSNEFNFDASIIGFDNLSTVLDNTSTTSSFLYTTKEHLDLGLSAGLTTDSLLKLTDQGDVFFNLGFGTGVYNGIKIFDSELKELEIADYKVFTKKVDLERGGIESGDAIAYDPAVEASARLTLTAHNTTTGDKEVIEYSVIDDGTDIYFTEIGNVSTGTTLVDSSFDFNASNAVRVNFTLNTDLTLGDDVEVTVVSNITKR